MTITPALSPEALASRTITNPSLRGEIIFLETSRESNERHTLLEITLSGKGGSLWRCHETISQELYCLAGILTVQIADQAIQLLPGASATVPARQTYRFINRTHEPCRFQCQFTPGFPGFEQFLQLAYGLARAGETTLRGVPKNPFALGYLALISNICLPGWMAVLRPALNWLGNQAIRNGVAADLQRRYFTIW